MNARELLRRASPSAACAFLIGILYLFVILYALAVPPTGRFEGGNFFEGYARDPRLMNFLWAVMAAINLLSLALIPMLGRRMPDPKSEWSIAAEPFGIAASIVSAVAFLTMLGSAPDLARSYLAAGPAGRAALNAVGLPQIDPYRVLSLGGLGIWFLILNLSALRRKTFSGFHAGLGIVLGVFLWVAVAAAVLHCDVLDLAASAVGGLCAPLWYFQTAARLLQPDGALSLFGGRP